MRYRFLLALFLVFMSAFFIGKGTMAYFTDTAETGTITFQTGSIELAKSPDGKLKTELNKVEAGKTVPVSGDGILYPADTYEMQVTAENDGELPAAIYGKLQLVQDADIVLKDSGQADKLSNHILLTGLYLKLTDEPSDDRNLSKEWFGDNNSIPLKDALDDRYRYIYGAGTGQKGIVKIRLQLDPQADFISNGALQDSLKLKLDIMAVQDDSTSREEFEERQGD